MLDGEYRASAIYTMAHKRIGMIYSLSSSGEMRNRRFIDVVNGGVNFGAWYPKVPTGSVNIINSNIMRMLGLKQDNLTEEKDFEARGDSDTNDFEIYKDFSYGSCYAVYENNDAKSDLHNVYYVHNENYSEYFEFIQDCTEQSLDYTNKEKIYLTI